MKQFSRTISVLPVQSIETACRWYADVLGLEVVYRHEGKQEGEETNYAVMTRDSVQVHLILDEPPPYGDTWTQAGTGYLYLRVYDIRAMYADVQARGIGFEHALETAIWGAEGFEIRDPGGNLVRIEGEM